MRFSYLLPLELLLLSAVTHAQSGSKQAFEFQQGWTEQQLEVWRVIEAWNDAFEQNDADRYFKHVDPEITVITPANPYRIEGLTADRREYEYGIKRGYSKVSLFQELQPYIKVSGDMAFATYYNRGWYGPDGTGTMVYLKETNVLIKRDGTWKIVHVHVSASK